jgi:hypothetical protein
VFFAFRQNDSGGWFQREPDIDHTVVIEAYDRDDAVRRAESLGLYFDGYGDCECCGPRWDEPGNDGDEQPVVWGDPVQNLSAEQKNPDADTYPWNQVVVHYLDGRRLYGQST